MLVLASESYATPRWRVTFSKLRTHREVRRRHGATATGGDVLVVMRKSSRPSEGDVAAIANAFAGAGGGRRTCCGCRAKAHRETGRERGSRNGAWLQERA